MILRVRRIFFEITTFPNTISPARTRGEARRPPLPRPSQARELLPIRAFPLGLAWTCFKFHAMRGRLVKKGN